MKYFSLILLFFAFNIKLKAQDTLIYNNGSKALVKVDEVNATQIKFHKTENLTGPAYLISTSEIKYIKYPNGTQDVFVSENKNKPANEDDFIKPADHVYGKDYNSKSSNEDSLIFRTTNLVYANFFDLMFMSPSINYESIQGKGNISIWVPLNIGLNPYGSRNYNTFSGSFWGVRKNYTVGLGLKYYFNGQKSSSFFIAPLFEYGSVVFNKAVASTYNYGGYSYTYGTTRKEQAPLYIGSLNFGNLFSFKNGFIILVQGGIGVRSQKTKMTSTYNYSGSIYNYDYLIYPVVKLGFSVGYRF